jgi:hypothetical protein
VFTLYNDKHKIDVLGMLVLTPQQVSVSIFVLTLSECWYKFYAIFLKARVDDIPFE